MQGLGFAAVRDLVSFLRYDASKRNPLRPPTASRRSRGPTASACRRAAGSCGTSSTRASTPTRQGRKVFDGLMPHVAGGGLGFFNHRFAQPTRHNGQHEEHLYPGDVFPFTYGDGDRPVQPKRQPTASCSRTAAEDAKLLPKVMHTQSAARVLAPQRLAGPHRPARARRTPTFPTTSASTPSAARSTARPPTRRARGIADNLLNPADYRPFLRALLDALDAWVRDGTAPPPSVYPRIDEGTLVDWRQKSTGFPACPGVRYPGGDPAAAGPRLTARTSPTKGRHHASSRRGVAGHYTVLVPKCGPTATTSARCCRPRWRCRWRRTPAGTCAATAGAEGMLASLLGLLHPVPGAKEAERKASGYLRSIRNLRRFRRLSQRSGRPRATGSSRGAILLAEDAKKLMGLLEQAEKVIPVEQ